MHVGKTFPRLTPGWYDLGLPNGYGPTYKVMTDYSSTAVGSLALQWRFGGAFNVSEIGSYDPVDRGIQHYRINNPDVPTSHMNFRRELRPGPYLPAPDGWMYHVYWYLEVLLDDVVMAWTEGTDKLTLGYTSHVVGNRIPPWSDLVDPAIWTNWQGDVVSASWFQVPDYHPYRH